MEIVKHFVINATCRVVGWSTFLGLLPVPIQQQFFDNLTEFLVVLANQIDLRFIVEFLGNVGGHLRMVFSAQGMVFSAQGHIWEFGQFSSKIQMSIFQM